MNFSTPVKVFTKVEAEALEVSTSEELFSFLKKAREMNNAGTLSIKDDQTFFEVQQVLQEKLENSSKAAQLVGAAVPFWGTSAQFPNGDGWKLVIVSAVANPPAATQQPMLQRPNGMG
jgi:hypothetical protein